jgi:hypothetical protein
MLRVPSTAVAAARRAARARRRARRAALPRLHVVGRVHAPESDMRPVLPARRALLAAVAAPAPAGGGVTVARRPRKDSFLAKLQRSAEAVAAAGDADGVALLAAEAAAAPYPVDRDVALRVVTLAALQRPSGGVGGGVGVPGDFAERVLSGLAANGCLAGMKCDDVGMVLDLMTRGKMASGDAPGAFRVELLSRALQLGLRRGTYTALIRAAGDAGGPPGEALALAIGMLHRALAVGREPNVAMFNAVLEACFRARDGARASAVLAEMARGGVPMNGKTLAVLLANTRDVSNVDAVVRLLKSQVSQAGLHLSPGMAAPFIKAYIAAAEEDAAAGDEREAARNLESCFALVEWFYIQGAGVTAEPLDMLVSHLGERGNAEGALFAWREMRRGWLGGPSRRGRRALVSAVAASDVPTRLDLVVWPTLEPHMAPRERRRLHRLRIAALGADDEAVLSSNPGTSGGDGEEVARDQAAVLHRWCAEGRTGEAVAWVEAVLRSHGTVDSRVLLALLSPRTVWRQPGEVVEGAYQGEVDEGDSMYPLDFVLKSLPMVRVEDGMRASVLDRVEAAIWSWAKDDLRLSSEVDGSVHHAPKPLPGQRSDCRRFLNRLLVRSNGAGD